MKQLESVHPGLLSLSDDFKNPPPVSALTKELWPHEGVMTAGDDVIPMVFIRSGRVGVPKAWASDPRVCTFAGVLDEMLAPAHPRVTQTPWIITSTNVDLWERPRSSASHAQWQAFDAAPAFSETELLSPEGQLMGLSWNLIKLSLLGTVDRSKYAWVAEGDHLHVSTVGDPSVFPKGLVPVAQSWSSWYPFGSLLSEEAFFEGIKGAPGLFDIRKFSFTGPSAELTIKMIKYLGGSPNAFQVTTNSK